MAWFFHPWQVQRWPEIDVALKALGGFATEDQIRDRTRIPSKQLHESLRLLYEMATLERSEDTYWFRGTAE